VDLCKATLIGNVGGDPEQRFTPAGKSIVNFSLACNRLGPPPTEGAERREETMWFRVVCFGRLGEQALNLISRGGRVYVEGRLQHRNFTGNDGQQRCSLEIVANDFMLLGPRQRGDMDERPMAVVPVGAAESDNLDDVPF
jgi:single-strand DNA-binding protein